VKVNLGLQPDPMTRGASREESLEGVPASSGQDCSSFFIKQTCRTKISDARTTQPPEPSQGRRKGAWMGDCMARLQDKKAGAHC
jgi:hypothetical protein